MEVLIMRGPSLHVLPQELNWVVVWRIGWELEDRQTTLVRFEESAGSLTGVIFRAVLDEDRVLRCLVEHLTQKVLVALRVEALFQALIEKASREEVNQAKHFVSPALARRFDDRLLPNMQPSDLH